ncbi:DUF421 domain-containing protein [Salinimicrobium sp. GXAS 041]|uniref:DUF421 domain-containing protein n=1 Tax=Salinimicrobium sp. GXAS 041 TaxID=3400806 RepID=UPI003C70E10B
MDKYFGVSTGPLLAVFLSAVAIYCAVILFTRIAGKRSFSKMSSFDFAMTIAIGSIIGSTLLLASVKLMTGIVGLASVYLLQQLVAYFRRFPLFQDLVENKPYLLMKGSEVLEENLKKSRVTRGDLRAKLREANVTNLSQVKAVVFETTGDISVLHGQEDQEVEEWLLKDVGE